MFHLCPYLIYYINVFPNQWYLQFQRIYLQTQLVSNFYLSVKVHFRFNIHYNRLEIGDIRTKQIFSFLSSFSISNTKILNLFSEIFYKFSNLFFCTKVHCFKYQEYLLRLQTKCFHKLTQKTINKVAIAIKLSILVVGFICLKLKILITTKLIEFSLLGAL